MGKDRKIRELKTRMPKSTVEKVILGTIATAGVLTAVAIAPAIFVALKKLGFLTKTSSSPFYVNTILGNLKNEGLVQFVREDRISKLRLTPSGEVKLRLYRVRDNLLCGDGKWDGKWRIVIFDIKETHRVARDSFRREITGLGFARLQNSVWVFPYDCEEFIGLLKTSFSLGKNVLYVIAERVEHEDKLLERYGLSR